LTGIEWVCADAEATSRSTTAASIFTRSPSGCGNVTRLDAALAEARRVLKPGGRFLCLEFTPEITPLLQPLYDSTASGSCRSSARSSRVIARPIPYLVESIRRFPRQSELSAEIERAGFDLVRFRNLTGGVAALHSAWRL